MKFKVGDKVKVREDLEVGMIYGPMYFIHGMEQYRGGIGEIIKTYHYEAVHLDVDEGCFIWTDGMLEPANEEADEIDQLAPVLAKVVKHWEASGTNSPDDSNRSIYTPVTETIDNVNHPQHYKHGEIETLDIIRMSLTDEEFRGFLKGNVLKYQMRAPFKHETPDEDYKKAKFYYDRLQEVEDNA